MRSARDFTWGCELELGDVPRIDLGGKGEWEQAERDIVNLRPPYQYVAADPLGIDPPVGGEINTRPTKSIAEQLTLIEEILELFPEEPTVACLMEFHVHVHVPGLIEDIDALKRLTRYVVENQHTVVKECVAYKEHPLMADTKTARTYLKWDMGRTMPEWMAQNIETLAEDFDDFIRIQCCGKDGVSRGRPFRYCVNTYCLKHTRTIEFRCFRASLDLGLLKNCFLFVEDFMDAALNNGPPAAEILDEQGYTFPPFWYDHDQYLGWEQTKYGEGRGKKKRKYIEVD